MKLKLFALFTALTALLSGCVGTPEPTETTAAPLEPTSSETAAPAASTLRVYCFQAGKADAFLFWNEAGAVLIDTGVSGYGKTILAKLEELGIRQLDYLILTHFDKDHVGGAKKLLGSIPIGTILQSNCPKEGADAYDKYVAALEGTGLEPVTVREAMRFSLGDAEFAVDPPALERYDRDESNNSSLIVTVTHGENRLLFTGDAEDLRLAEFLQSDPAPCVFVKLPHHGVWQPTPRDLLLQTAPAWALITSSDEEPEDPETLALLEERGVQTFLTRTAPVLLTSDGHALTVEYAMP
jgi:beta-lactamase superfamily II metal-dependent hydrolase